MWPRRFTGLDAQPELWNQSGERRGATSPHRETDDIWLRFIPCTPHSVRRLSEASMPPGRPGWQKLPAVRRLYDEVTTLIRPAHFGGVAITRIPAGKMVYPHHDRGGWHSEYDKVWLILRANDW